MIPCSRTRARPRDCSRDMVDPNGPASNCPRCGNSILLSEFRQDGFLRSRALPGGGPYYEHSCGKCGTPLVLEVDPDGAQVISTRKPPGILGAILAGQAETTRFRAPEAARDGTNRGDAGRPDVEDEGDGKDRKFHRFRDTTDSRPPATDVEGPGELDRCRRLLGVREYATRKEVLAAFRDRSKLFHPDRFARLDEDFQSLAHEKFIELRAARDKLIGTLNAEEGGDS